MGRLTLNMLLSFAQFEREIAGERIRDKIAASKAKGMWMGGTVSLGYDATDRKLVINSAEAATVRIIFRRYSELGSVALLQEELDGKGIRSKKRNGPNGRQAGSKPFSRGILYLILQNRLYRGEVVHKGSVYPGQHEAIIDPKLWDRVQEKLASNRRERSLAAAAEAPSLLSGVIYDSDGNRMTPTHANSRGKRYRYYISASMLGRGLPDKNPIRVPAVEVERLVLDRLRALLGDQTELLRRLEPLGLNASELEAALKAAGAMTRAWMVRPPDEIRALVREIVQRVSMMSGEIEIKFCINGLAESLGVHAARKASEDTFRLRVGAQFHLASRGKRIIVGERIDRKNNLQCLNLMQEAFAARALVLSEGGESLTAMARRLGKCQVRLTGLVRLSYLAPSIIEELISGKRPAAAGAKRLLRLSKNLPLNWQKQREFLGLK